MKNFIVIFFAGFVASTYGLGDLGLTDDLLGGALGGGNAAGAAISEANGKTPGLTSNPLISVPKTLGLGGNKECIKLCPIKVANEGKKCIKPTDYPGVPMCYQINGKNKYIWPCTNDRRQDDEEDEEEED